MTRGFVPLVPARFTLTEHGTPFSERYNDVYHAEQGALEQADHVFLGGNRLPERWRGRQRFTVCETGFGLGKNFLALWRAWRRDTQRSERLHMLSFEAHPFSRDILTQQLRRLPDDLQPLVDQLVNAWPPLLPGIHRLEFESGRLTLTLVFGDIGQTVKQVQARVDAFFLDGFAPRNNPEMWTRTVFGQLVRIARPGATAATWSAAGIVRRTLRDAGFLVDMAPGFAGKRQMTVATLRPGLGRNPASAAGPVLIVGGGLAGAGIAHSLALQGSEVTVVDPVFRLGRGASHRGHLAAALTPLISRDDDIRARLSRAGTLRAQHRWQDLPPSGRPQQCGTVELVADAHEAYERVRTLQLLKFPSDWVRWMSAAEVTALAGFKVDQPGVYFSAGQLARPEPLLEALFDHPLIQCVTGRVEHLERHGVADWTATLESKERLEAAVVVLANAGHAKTLFSTFAALHGLPKFSAMHQLAGQVSYFSDSASARSAQIIVGGVGYWLPAVDNISVGGSTYIPNAQSSCVTDSGHEAVFDKLGALLNVSASEVAQWLTQPAGWAGWRAVASGRLPIVGPVYPEGDAWLACAYGSRGLTWSALAGDVIAAFLYQEPQVIERDLLKAIAPR